MRIANYRDDVLWAIAYKMGLDPAKEFLNDEGSSLDSYINAWVRRTWDSTDHPEWTTIQEFIPDINHQVPWQAIPIGTSAPVVLSRPLKVYLVDPRVSPYPIDTRFREWDEGLHVGFDHGATVWIKYLGTPPKFTSVPWNSAITYKKDDLVYSILTGQCYRSLVSNNLGNDPTGQQGAAPPPLTVELVQAAVPETPAIPGRTQITKITQLTELLDTWQTLHTWDFLDGTGAIIGTATYLAPLGAAPADVLTAIYNSLDANVALNAFTFTLDLTNLTIQIEANQLFAVRSYYYSSPPLPADTVMTGVPADPTELVYGDDAALVTVGPYPTPPIYTVYNTIDNLQYYLAAVVFVPAKAQIIKLTMTADSAIRGATYDLTFIDSSITSHLIEYVNNHPGQSSLGILQGIVDEIQASPDPFFSAMSTSIDPRLLTLTFASWDMVSLDAEVVPAGNAWWAVIKFPLALVEPVVRGAYADALREAGQTDKAMAEEQVTVQEQADRMSKALAPGYTDLTDQRAPAPRYRGKLPAQQPTGAGK